MSSSILNPEDAREYPSRPIVSVAGIVIRENHVLLIRRGREPLKGAWSLPGGGLLLGERIEVGVRREVLEETGLDARPVELIEVLDRISRDPSGRAQYHYVLLDWLCIVQTATLSDGTLPRVTAASDAAEAVWAHLDALSALDLEPVTVRVIERAAHRAKELAFS